MLYPIKFSHLFRQRTHRCKNYDYGSNGSYFVTINTLKQIPFLGRIVTTDKGPSLRPSEIGQIVIKHWNEIPNHYPYVKLDAYVIMPDHIHGILTFHKDEPHIYAPNKFGPQSCNLGAVIRGFKSSVKKYANENQIEFSWQPRYHDVIIRTDEELINIRQYIHENLIRSHD